METYIKWYTKTNKFGWINAILAVVLLYELIYFDNPTFFKIVLGVIFAANAFIALVRLIADAFKIKSFLKVAFNRNYLLSLLLRIKTT